jgi:hypothetical protein
VLPPAQNGFRQIDKEERDDVKRIEDTASQLHTCKSQTRPQSDST